MATDQVVLARPIATLPPEVKRRERRTRLTTFVLLAPAALVAVAFLAYPLVFIFQMSFTEGS